jgi:methionyl-tRNA formyltransferase
MKIIFMGTPDFAVPTLRGLLQSSHEVVAVFTQPPKPKGRGMKVIKSPVHQVAEDAGVVVYCPDTLKNPEIWKIVDQIECDIVVVVAYGFIIPKQILYSKKYGCINLHPSKLPRFRGAAPLQRTIIEGDKESAICVIKMDEGLDTGDILLQEDIQLKDNVTLQELHDFCSVRGAQLVVEVLDNIDTIIPKQQPSEGLVYAQKLTKDEGVIDWNFPALLIDRKIRGMNPWPGVFFDYHGEMIKIIKASCVDYCSTHLPGTIIAEESIVVCGEGGLKIEKVQRPGKGPITFRELLAQINASDVLHS